MVDELEVLNPKTLSNTMWEAPILNNFKLPSLAKFDGHNDPYEHVASINTQMAIIEAHNSLKCKIIYVTFKDITLTHRSLSPTTIT